ncbi:MAG: 5-(carboxyamino)imidazole ribonucleotide synthase [Flavobacteriales bacterium]|nr:5-(carboxyamino)imidazole ribonucleotide synthase [Flavobacteriales bacterium]
MTTDGTGPGRGGCGATSYLCQVLRRQVIAMLGGGQLGRMFIENALRYDAIVHVLDPDPQAPCARLAHRFVQGRFDDHDTVLAFAKDADVVGIEIEHVSLSALEELAAMGKVVVPDPAALRTIQDKGTQKDFYAAQGIATAAYQLVSSKAELAERITGYPVFVKARRGGYDGKGVTALKGPDELKSLFEGPYVLESCADIAKELAVVGVRDRQGNSAFYPLVEMVFDDALNLVDHLLAPASVPFEVEEQAMDLARKVIDGLGSAGIFAVELFLLRNGRVLVNETAPRVHNSGHFSMEACGSSQFDQLLRVLLGLPLGSTTMSGFAAMVNLIGQESEGIPKVEGLDVLLSQPDVFLHLYGKRKTRPGRKMGHVNFLAQDMDTLHERIKIVKEAVRIVPEPGLVDHS